MADPFDEATPETNRQLARALLYYTTAQASSLLSERLPGTQHLILVRDGKTGNVIVVMDSSEDFAQAIACMKDGLAKVEKIDAEATQQQKDQNGKLN